MKQIGAKQFSATPRKWKSDTFHLHNLDHAPSFGSTAVRIELENMAQQVYNYAFPELRVRISSHLEGIRGRAALSLANLNTKLWTSRVLKVSSQPSSRLWNNWWTIQPSHIMTCHELRKWCAFQKNNAYCFIVTKEYLKAHRKLSNSTRYSYNEEGLVFNLADTHWPLNTTKKDDGLCFSTFSTIKYFLQTFAG